MKFSPSSETVVFSNYPDDCARLILRSDYARVPVEYIGSGSPWDSIQVGFTPALAAPLTPGAGPGFHSLTGFGPWGPAPTIFLHRLTSPKGDERLVRVALGLHWNFVRGDPSRYMVGDVETYLRKEREEGGSAEGYWSFWELYLCGDVYAPAHWSPGSRWKGLSPGVPPMVFIPSGHTFIVPGRALIKGNDIYYGEHAWIRMFAGQPDPTSHSQLRIRYDVEGKAGVIVGRLLSNEHVEFQVESGPLLPWPHESKKSPQSRPSG